MKLIKFEHEYDFGHEIDLSILRFGWRDLIHFSAGWSVYSTPEVDLGLSLTTFKGLTFELSVYKLYVGLSFWSKN